MFTVEVCSNKEVELPTRVISRWQTLSKRPTRKEAEVDMAWFCHDTEGFLGACSTQVTRGLQIELRLLEDGKLLLAKPLNCTDAP